MLWLLLSTFDWDCLSQSSEITLKSLKMDATSFSEFLIKDYTATQCEHPVTESILKMGFHERLK